MQLSVVIPTYNGAHLLSQCLLYLQKSLTTIPNHEIIVVDNHSQDKTSELLRATYPDVQHIALDKNYGFAKAVNTGIQRSKGTFVLILNNDCLVEPDTISVLMSFLQTHPDYVATQPIVVNPEADVENIGYIVDLKQGKAHPIIQVNDELAMRNRADIFKEGSVYGLSAACLLIRTDVFNYVSMFDEAFGSYLEDVDLFIRLAKKGYHFAPCLATKVTHAHMSTSSKMGAYKEWHDLTNWQRIIAKNYPPSFILRHFPFLFYRASSQFERLDEKIGTI